NKNLKKKYEDTINATIELKKIKNAAQDLKTAEKLHEIKTKLQDYLQNSDLFAYCSYEILENPKTKESQQRTRDQAQDIINTILNQKTDHISLSLQLIPTAEEYGSYFKLEEFKKLFSYVKLAILFEESTDLAAVGRYTFNLIVTFGDAESAINYLVSYQSEQKNKIELELYKC